MLRVGLRHTRLGQIASGQYGTSWSRHAAVVKLPPHLSDLESSLVSREMGFKAMLHEGAFLLATVTGALELPAGIDKQGLIST